MTLLETNNQLHILISYRRYNLSMPQCRNFMRNLCDVAALPFKAHANYGTWFADFGWIRIHLYKQYHLNCQSEKSINNVSDNRIP